MACREDILVVLGIRDMMLCLTVFMKFETGSFDLPPTHKGRRRIQTGTWSMPGSQSERRTVARSHTSTRVSSEASQTTQHWQQYV